MAAGFRVPGGHLHAILQRQLQIEVKKMTKPPDILFKNKIHKILGIVSPSIFWRELLNGNSDVIAYAIATGHATDWLKQEVDDERTD